MHKSMNRSIFLAICLFLFSVTAFGQDLPKLPSDPAIHQGTLPNGTKWFVCVNPSTKSMADFVLVQKTGTDTPGITCDPLRVAKASLGNLPHFRKRTPEEFLASKGCMPGRDGYVKVTDEATIYRFEDILLSDEKAVIDSTLLLLFDLVNFSNTSPGESAEGCYSPSNQAIIVSGDVKLDVIVSKMNNISLMVNAGESRLGSTKYTWKSKEGGAEFLNIKDNSLSSSVSFTWRFPRTAEQFMSTIQPAIFEMIMTEFGLVSLSSIKDNMKAAKLPWTHADWSYTPSTQTNSDEVFNVTVRCNENDRETLLAIMSGTFSAIVSGKTTVRGFLSAKEAGTTSLAKKIAYPLKNNDEFADRCINAFLHKGSLSSLKAKYDFYVSRDIPDTTELGMFNNVVKASFSDHSNLAVACSGASEVAPDVMQTIFQAAWENADFVETRLFNVDLEYPDFEAPDSKFKITTVKADAQSGSSIWTFTNGMTVVYKKMPTGGNVFYSLALNGGFGNLPGLIGGEGAFVRDYFDMCRINGCPADDFFNALALKGIYMKPAVSLNDTRISGVTPAAELPVMMNALLSVLYERESSVDDFLYYVSCQVLESRQPATTGSRMAEIDRIICPDNKYSEFGNAASLTGDFPRRVDQLFKSLGAKADDGVLVLVGDMDETALKKVLTPFMSNFYTAQKAFPRTQYRYQPVSGTSVYTVDGFEDCIDVVMTAPYSFTADNSLAAEAAQIALKRHIAEALVGTGYTAEVVIKLTSHPQERLNVRISARRANPEGFGSDTRQADVMSALAVLRQALSNMADIKMSASELKACKNYIKGELSVSLDNPAWWIKALNMRYLGGKDMYSNILSKADGINMNKIQNMFNALSKGTRVEYVTKAKGI